jgi:hypothetical protein
MHALCPPSFEARSTARGAVELTPQDDVGVLAARPTDRHLLDDGEIGIAI